VVITGFSVMGLVIAFTSSGAAGASGAGSLDPTFGKGGIAISNVGGFPTDSVEQPNGDFLVSLDFGASSGVARFLSGTRGRYDRDVRASKDSRSTEKTHRFCR
jgi:hypothetical protein